MNTINEQENQTRQFIEQLKPGDTFTALTSRYNHMRTHVVAKTTKTQIITVPSNYPNAPTLRFHKSDGHLIGERDWNTTHIIDPEWVAELTAYREAERRMNTLVNDLNAIEWKRLTANFLESILNMVKTEISHRKAEEEKTS